MNQMGDEMTWSHAVPALMLSITVATARPVDGQQLQLMEAGVHTSDTAQSSDVRPSGLTLGIKSVGWSIYGSLLGGLVGMEVDERRCRRHRGPGMGSIFDPCFLYTSDGTSVGWFGGAIVGSTFGAVRVAEKRGCSRSAAILRAATGAVAGSAPGIMIVAAHPARYPPSRSILIGTAPILSGVGAALAVAGCHTS